MNPERILIAAEAVGLGRAALARAADYAKERVVFGRPIGQNQAIQHPLAQCWMELEAGPSDGVQARPGSTTTAWPAARRPTRRNISAAEAGVQGLRDRDDDAWRLWATPRNFTSSAICARSMIPRIAPVTPQLILCFIAEKVLGLPKSY